MPLKSDVRPRITRGPLGVQIGSNILPLAIGSEAMWQLEPWEHVVFEAGHARDPVAPEGEDVKTDTMARATGGGVEICTY
jgi:hypothetical protein